MISSNCLANRHSRFIGLICLLFIFFMGSCSGNKEQVAWVERLDPGIDKILGPDPKIEVLANGFAWCEGPLWLKDKQTLLFSDIPNNTIFKWSASKGKEMYLKPSGYTNARPRGGEMGSNALLLNPSGRLVLCQHGDRRVAAMDAPLDSPQARFITLAGDYLGKSFNSPNDAVFRSNGDLYFTDPPYGLEARMADPAKALSFQGVYRLGTDGVVHLLLDSISRPNGIAFMPGEKTLLIANSDSTKPVWYAYDCIGDSLSNGRIFYDATGAISSGIGLPDGMKIDHEGNVFATGPGGIFIFNSSGKLLGKIRTRVASSNISFGDDEKTLFITNHQNLLRIRLRE